MRVPLSLALLAAAACHTSSPEYLDQPGGGQTIGGSRGGGSGSGVDAAVDAPPAVSTFRACLITELRSGSACATTGAGGLTVTLGSLTVLTADDGAFSLIPPMGTGLTWRVTGAGIVTTLQPYSALTEIPVISSADYQMQLDNQAAVVQPGQGRWSWRRTTRGSPSRAWPRPRLRSSRRSTICRSRRSGMPARGRPQIRARCG